MQNQAIISIILLQNVETFVPEFIEILSEFSTNQNFCGCACTPTSYTTDWCCHRRWMTWTSRALYPCRDWVPNPFRSHKDVSDYRSDSDTKWPPNGVLFMSRKHQVREKYYPSVDKENKSVSELFALAHIFSKADTSRSSLISERSRQSRRHGWAFGD